MPQEHRERWTTETGRAKTLRRSLHGCSALFRLFQSISPSASGMRPVPLRDDARRSASVRRLAEVDLWRLVGACCRRLVVGSLVRAGDLGGHELRKLRDVRVVGANGVVVITAGHGDSVFRSGQLVLQLREIAIGLELRI